MYSMAPFQYVVGYWNVRGLRGRAAEVEVLLKWTDLCGLGETRLHSDLEFVLPGFAVYRNNEGSGVLLAVRQTVPHRPFLVLDCPGGVAVAVHVWSGGGWVLVVALYVAGNFSARDWEDWLGTLPRPVILCGDLNAHHSLWGSQRQNKKGSVVAASLGSQDLVALNDGSSTFVRWYAGNLQESVLDLAICSSSLAGHLAAVVSDDLRSSDHLPILIGASLAGPLHGLSTDVKREGVVGQSAPRVVSGAYGQFLQKWGLGRGRGRKVGRRVRSNPPWWTEGCSVAVHDRRRAYRRFRRWAVGIRWEAFQVAARSAKRIIRAAKRSYGVRLCAAVGSGLSLAQVWRRVTPDRGNSPTVSWVFSSNGREVLRGVLMAEAFAVRFMSVYDCPRGDACGFGPVESVSGDAAEDAPFTVAEIKGVLEGCKDGATGLDRVSYTDIRSMSEQALLDLVGLFNDVFEGGAVPEAWTCAILVPVCKAGKERFLVTNYRPISLLSCVSKVYERLLAERLTWFIEKNNCLHASQFGFRRNRSAQDAILYFETAVREAWLHGTVVVAVFLDIRAAYDTVVLDWVLHDLQAMGVSSKLISALEALMSSRTFVVRAGGAYSCSHVTSRGLPQGSCLSPLLFAVVMDAMLREVSLWANVDAFADDVALWVTGDDLHVVRLAVQAAVAVACRCLGSRGLSLSSGKSQVMVFSRGGSDEVDVLINGELVHSSREVRYLGVLLDPRLTWSSEVTELRKRVAGAKSILSYLAGDPLTAKRSVLRGVFRSFIQSRLDYHLPFLCSNVTTLRKVQVSVNECLRVVSGCLPSTSIPALHVELGCMPQEWRARFLLLRLAIRCVARGQEDLVGRIILDYCLLGPLARSALGSGGYAAQMYLDSEISRFPLCAVVPPMGPWIWGPALEGCVIEEGGRDLGLAVYCDASFSSELWEGGVGVFVPSLKWRRAWSLGAVPSAFVAEMAAISQALLVGLEARAIRFVVFSDSLSAIRALQWHIRSLNFRHPSILEVACRLYEALRVGVIVKIGWVRGHSGVHGNEEADELSRQARIRQDCDALSVAVTAADLRPVAYSVVKAGWEDEWERSAKGRCLFALHPSVDLPRTLDRLRGCEARVLSRLRTGHVLLNAWRFQLGMSHSALCPCGLANETVEHFLLECTRHRVAREDMRRAVGEMGTLHDLLRVEPHAGPGCLRVLRAVAKYCFSTGRFS